MTKHVLKPLIDLLGWDYWHNRRRESNNKRSNLENNYDCEEAQQKKQKTAG
jgi:hypothetical protein